MSLRGAVRYRVKTYPNGKRVRFAFDALDRVIERREMPRVRVTRTRKKLNNRRRRIGLR